MQRDTSAAKRILLAEDSDRDAELVLHELKRSGLKFESRRVQTEADFRRALDEFRPQLILSDYVMPGFSGIAALRICREAGIDIPFIFVSGTIGEDVAVESMKAGADDYVMKTNLIRLGPTVVRALREAELRQGGKVSEAALLRAQTLAKLAHVISGPDGTFESWSDTLPQMLGLDPAAMPKSTREWLALVHPEDRASLRAKAIEAARTGARIELEYRLRRADGSWINIKQTSEALIDASIASGKPRWFGTMQDVTERRRVEEDLRRFRLALDNSADIILIIDRTTMRHVDANQAGCRLLGYTREELLRLGPQDILPFSRSDLEKTYDELIADPSRSGGMQSHYRCKDGSLLPVESTRHVIRSGDSWLITVISRDIRRRVAAEEKQRSMRQLLDNIVENIPTAVQLKSVEDGFRVVMWNKAAEQMYGVPRQEAIGKNVRDLWPKPDADRFHAADLELIAGGRMRDYPDLPARTKDGGEIHVHMRKVALFDGTGTATHLLVIADDITAQLVDQERLRESEARFRSLSQLSSDWFWQQDEEFRFTEFTSGDSAQGWGGNQKSALGLRPWELPGISPLSGNLDEHKAAYEAHLPFRNFEYQYTNTDGTTKFISASGEPVFDAGGRFTGYRGVATEISERKRTERELLRFRTAMDLSGDSIVLIDPAAMRYVYANKAACEQTGRSREQMLQMGPQDLMPMDRAAISKEYDEVIAAGEQGATFERRIIRNDGVELWVEMHRRALRTEDGMVIVTISRDITDRKEADEKIRRLSRVHAVLSSINALIVRVSERDELFKEACRIAVEQGGFKMAWIGIVDSAAQKIVRIASAGAEPEFLTLIQDRFTLREDAPHGNSKSARAVREKKAMVSNEIKDDAQVLFAKERQERGIRSMAILPLLVSDNAIGVLALYAGEAGFFDEEELKLLHELAGDIAFAIDHIEKAGRLDYLAYYDQLTGLANRTLFLERVNQSIIAASQAETKFALAILDLERFRTINDSLGRQAGDALIKLVAERLTLAGGPAGVSRISADHFALVLGTVKGRSEAGRIMADALRKCFDAPFRVQDTEVRISAKAGVAQFPGDATGAETLLRNAEAALRRGKEGGERITFHSAEMTSRIAESLTLENKLRQALEKEEFVLHYQPKVDLDTRRIVGVEALIRWQSPERGLVPPGIFIPLLEETGLILQVGAWALKRATRDHGLWLQQGVPAPRIAVNVSAIQLRQRDFVQVVTEAIAGGADPTAIDIEITESLLMDDVAGNIVKLAALRELGMKISIDDFGTGYSSLGYLAKLPVHILKIDRSFIVAMMNNSDTMTLVSTIISLAHSLRLDVVAEGVELEDQAKMLHLLRCDQMQGYLISKPVPMDDLTPMLREKNRNPA